MASNGDKLRVEGSCMRSSAKLRRGHEALPSNALDSNVIPIRGSERKIVLWLKILTLPVNSCFLDFLLK